MNPDPALVELIDLWYELPVLVGEDWPELRPRLLTAVEELATAPPTEYERRALALLRLLLGHAEVKKRLAPALIGKTIPTDRAADAERGTRTPPASQLALRAGILPPDLDGAGRWINADVEPGPADRPGTFVLGFDVDDGPREDSVSEPLRDLGTPDTWPATLTVRVNGVDAEAEALADTLTVPARGPSPDRARFLITPARAGTLTLQATFWRSGSLVQVLHLNVSGHAVRVRAQGPSRTAVAEVRDRGLSVQVRPAPGGREYEIVVSGGIGHAVRAPLHKTDGALHAIAVQARRPLWAVTAEWGPLSEGPTRTGLDLPDDVHAHHTRLLAEAGCRMFRDLFFDGADAQLEEVGRRIQEYLTGAGPRSVQFVTDRPLLPWHLMCPVEHMRDADFGQILGIRHRVDCIPVAAHAGRGITEVAIDTRRGLDVTLGLNRAIDRGGRRDLVAKQEAYWRDYDDKGLARLTVHDRQEPVFDSLCGTGGSAGIVYLYCHAVAHDADDDGPANPRLAVEGTTGGILLRSLRDHGTALPGSPVIVLNACGTTVTSALSTEGFLTHFLERSRGVLGTEADIPAPFAAAWATAFFDRLLSGEPIGEAVRATREHFAVAHRNPLGLLYALYCNGDTVLRPALATG
ncbi:CHAT domain-containing protein [Streptomyces sp. NPDC026672]|uniref:CHAT domain-containing protein n=1 Tax=unclassified Streptomyces TaxID=2593676 RepID=UPI00340CDDA8